MYKAVYKNLNAKELESVNILRKVEEFIITDTEDVAENIKNASCVVSKSKDGTFLNYEQFDWLDVEFASELLLQEEF